MDKRYIFSPYAEGVFEVEPDHFGVELAEQRLGGWRLAPKDPKFDGQPRQGDKPLAGPDPEPPDTRLKPKRKYTRRTK